LRDSTEEAEASLECAAKAAFKSGVDAEADGLRREREKDGRDRSDVDVDVVVVVILGLAFWPCWGPEKKVRVRSTGSVERCGPCLPPLVAVAVVISTGGAPLWPL
jgi:hypothetical protein